MQGADRLPHKIMTGAKKMIDRPEETAGKGVKVTLRASGAVRLIEARNTRISAGSSWRLDAGNNNLDEFVITFNQQQPNLGSYQLGANSEVSVSFSQDSPEGGELHSLEEGVLELRAVSSMSPLKFEGKFHGKNNTHDFSLEDGEFLFQE
ncbi:hypothetical protein [Pseudomonas fluorescens]|nr:hypothetical protein [Pseudomonas fluorescens]